jgi:hypothetical protein
VCCCNITSHKQAQASPSKATAAASTNGSVVVHTSQYKVGDVVTGKVNMKRHIIMPPAVMIDLQGHSTGRVCVTEICDIDEWTDTTYKR